MKYNDEFGKIKIIFQVAVPYNGVVQANNTIAWNEPAEIFPVRPIHHIPISQQVVVEHNNQQQIPEQSNFIPIQMSQNQAQLLFSSTEGSQNVDRPA